MIFDYFTLSLIALAFILGRRSAYNKGRVTGQRECLLIIRTRFPNIYKMLQKEITENPNVLKRD